MINAKLVTCGLCQNYYADPRQVSHMTVNGNNERACCF